MRRWPAPPPEWVGWVVVLAAFVLIAIDTAYRIVLLQIQTGK